MNLLLVTGTQFKAVLDALLVLPVRDVDEPDEVLVPVSELTLRPGHSAGAGPPGGQTTHDQQAVTEDHVTLLQLLLVSPHLQRRVSKIISEKRNLNICKHRQ